MMVKNAQLMFVVLGFLVGMPAIATMNCPGVFLMADSGAIVRREILLPPRASEPVVIDAEGQFSQMLGDVKEKVRSTRRRFHLDLGYQLVRGALDRFRTTMGSYEHAGEEYPAAYSALYTNLAMLFEPKRDQQVINLRKRIQDLNNQIDLIRAEVPLGQATFEGGSLSDDPVRVRSFSESQEYEIQKLKEERDKAGKAIETLEAQEAKVLQDVRATLSAVQNYVPKLEQAATKLRNARILIRHYKKNRSLLRKRFAQARSDGAEGIVETVKIVDGDHTTVQDLQITSLDDIDEAIRLQRDRVRLISGGPLFRMFPFQLGFYDPYGNELKRTAIQYAKDFDALNRIYEFMSYEIDHADDGVVTPTVLAIYNDIRETVLSHRVMRPAFRSTVSLSIFLFNEQWRLHRESRADGLEFAGIDTVISEVLPTDFIEGVKKRAGIDTIEEKLSWQSYLPMGFIQAAAFSLASGYLSSYFVPYGEMLDTAADGLAYSVVSTGQFLTYDVVGNAYYIFDSKRSGEDWRFYNMWENAEWTSRDDSGNRQLSVKIAKAHERFEEYISSPIRGLAAAHKDYTDNGMWDSTDPDVQNKYSLKVVRFSMAGARYFAQLAEEESLRLAEIQQTRNFQDYVSNVRSLIEKSELALVQVAMLPDQNSYMEAAKALVADAAGDARTKVPPSAVQSAMDAVGGSARQVGEAEYEAFPELRALVRSLMMYRAHYLENKDHDSALDFADVINERVNAYLTRDSVLVDRIVNDSGADGGR